MHVHISLTRSPLARHGCAYSLFHTGGAESNIASQMTHKGISQEIGRFVEGDNG